MPAKPDKQRAAEYARKLRNEGLRRVCVWVPEALADELRNYAEKLRNKRKPK